MVSASHEMQRHSRGVEQALTSIDELLDDPEIIAALNYAAEVYLGSYRKLSGEDFFLHPYGAFERLAAVTSDKDVLIAVILHDAVELNPGVTVEEIANLFGDRVARLVSSVTKDSTIADREERNDAYLQVVENAEDEGVILLALVDKIDNLTDILDFIDVHGVKVLDRFKGTPAEQLQWYVSVLEIARCKEPTSPLTFQLDEVVATFSATVQTIGDNRNAKLSDVA